jgi:hypothetical protein
LTCAMIALRCFARSGVATMVSSSHGTVDGVPVGEEATQVCGQQSRYVWQRDRHPFKPFAAEWLHSELLSDRTGVDCSTQTIRATRVFTNNDPNSLWLLLYRCCAEQPRLSRRACGTGASKDRLARWIRLTDVQHTPLISTDFRSWCAGQRESA